MVVQRHTTQRSVDPFLIIDAPVRFGEVLRLGSCVDDFSCMLFLPELGVEGFDDPVLPRRSRVDRRGFHPKVAQQLLSASGPLSYRT